MFRDRTADRFNQEMRLILAITLSLAAWRSSEPRAPGLPLPAP